MRRNLDFKKLYSNTLKEDLLLTDDINELTKKDLLFSELVRQLTWLLQFDRAMPDHSTSAAK